MKQQSTSGKEKGFYGVPCLCQTCPKRGKKGFVSES